MPYIVVDNFNLGLDTRRTAAAAPPGSLRKLVNAYINRGGEIQKRGAFQGVSVDLTNTYGLASDGFGKLLVFYKPGAALPGAPFPSWIVARNANYGTQVNGILDYEYYNSTWYTTPWYDGDINTRHMAYDTGVLAFFNPPTTGQPSGKFAGLSVKSGRMYTATEFALTWSQLNNPNTWVVAAGAGFVDVSTQASRSDYPITVRPYGDYLAVFLRNSVQIWSVDADPANNRLVQVLPNLSCVSMKAAVPYGDQDVFFLSRTGVRSLRARDSSGLASVSDVGTPIDEELFPFITVASDLERLTQFVGAFEPVNGQYWLRRPKGGPLDPGGIYVYTFHPSAKISAWSEFTEPAGSTGITDIVEMNGELYLRDSQSLWKYNPTVYDATQPEVWTPYFDAGDPATVKQFTSVDIGAKGTWSVSYNSTPNDETWSESLGNLQSNTWDKLNIGMGVRSSHIQLRLVGPSTLADARISKMAIHYDKGVTG